MKCCHASRMIVLLGAAVFSSCAPPIDSAQSSVPGSSTVAKADKSLNGVLFDEVNAYRRSKGLKDIQRHTGLERLAQQHCEYLRQHRGSFSIYGKNVSHYGFDGRAVVARSSYQMPNTSENVAAAFNAGGNPAPAVFALWKESKDHHKNMLDSWSHSGVGVVVDADGTVFATQMFGLVNYSQLSTRDRMNSF